MYQRPDGLYEKKITVNGKRLPPFRGRSEQEVYRKILEYRGKVERGRLFSTIADEWKEYHFKGLSYNSTKNYSPAHKRAVAEFGEIPIKQIKAQDINKFLYSFAKQGYAQKTVSTQLLIINLILTYAVICDDIEYNPATSVRIPKNLSKTKRDIPSEEDIEAVKNSLSCTFGLFAYFLLYTGCRRGEALALQYKDINVENKTIKICKSVYQENNNPKIKKPKTKAGMREIILLDKLLKVLKIGKPNDYIFHNYNNELITETQFQRQWELYQKETGLKITPHQLRHAYATILFEAGINEKDAQELLGHSSITLTRDIYTHISKSRKEKTREILNKANI